MRKKIEDVLTAEGARTMTPKELVEWVNKHELIKPELKEDIEYEAYGDYIYKCNWGHKDNYKKNMLLEYN